MISNLYSAYFGLYKTLVFFQGSPKSEQNTSDPGGLLGHPPSTMPMFLKSKHSKGDGCIYVIYSMKKALCHRGTQ